MTTYQKLLYCGFKPLRTRLNVRNGHKEHLFSDGVNDVILYEGGYF